MGRRREDLAERLWPDKLQEVQDTLSRSLDLPVLFVDPLGRPLTACEDLSGFCRRFTRRIAVLRPCLECGRGEGEEEPDAVGVLRFRPLLHLCPLGVTDVALPILSAGEILGHLVTAQVTVEGEQEEARAADAGAAPREAEEYAVLLSRLPRRARAEMESAAAALSVVTWLIGALAAARRRNLRLAERIREMGRWTQEHVVTDAVTAVANRRRFCETLGAEILRARRYRRPLSVAALDIQGFRRINDEFGHDVGDAVLRAVAQCLAGTVRQTDLVGRVGGDEFALLLPETARHEAMLALARVKANTEELNASGELPAEVRLAMGIADEVTETEEMLAAALGEARQARYAGSIVG